MSAITGEQRTDSFNIPHDCIDYARHFILRTREKKDNKKCIN